MSSSRPTRATSTASALGVMREPADAADMTQEAFVRLLCSLRTYRAETKFTTWLYRLTTNICLDGLRRRQRPLGSLDADGWPSCGPHDETPGRGPTARRSGANRPRSCAPPSIGCRRSNAWR
jgi:DNA-directed RNA polymerase specialized sigma24 family protein